jgi:hypothetical protein
MAFILTKTNLGCPWIAAVPADHMLSEFKLGNSPAGEPF